MAHAIRSEASPLLADQILERPQSAHSLFLLLSQIELIRGENKNALKLRGKPLTNDSLFSMLAKVDHLYRDRVEELSLKERVYGVACFHRIRQSVLIATHKPRALEVVASDIFDIITCCWSPDQISQDTVADIKPENYWFFRDQKFSFLDFIDENGKPQSICEQELIRMARERAVADLELQRALEQYDQIKASADRLFHASQSEKPPLLEFGNCLFDLVIDFFSPGSRISE